MRHALPLLATIVLGLVGCGERADGPRESGAGGTPTVAAVNYPLAFFAERIGGNHVRVLFPAPADEDPAWWKPDDATIQLYQQADRVLLNGATYAKWVPKVTLPLSRLVDTSKTARDRYIAMPGAVTHAHGPEGAHEHSGTAFTTWLDLRIAAEQADAVAEALASLLPEHADEVRANHAALRKELEGLDAEIRRIVAQDPQRPLIVSHPVYQYFTRAYGLNTRSVHWEPGEMPEEAAWRELAAIHGEFPARWMLWEGVPLPEVAVRLRENGIESVVFAPCGNRPESGDFLSVMRANVENLKAVFAP